MDIPNDFICEETGIIAVESDFCQMCSLLIQEAQTFAGADPQAAINVIGNTQDHIT